jgi:hypothetical protein
METKMKIKKLNLSICCMCNNVAVMDIDKQKFCQYHGDKEILNRTVYKNENLPGISSSFPDYNRGELLDYKRKLITRAEKIHKKVNTDFEAIQLESEIIMNFDDCIFSIDHFRLNDKMLKVIYEDKEYLFTWYEELQVNQDSIIHYMKNHIIKLAFLLVNGNIVKYY